MQRSLSRWFIALCAAPLMLVSSAAMAGTGADACNLIAGGTCMFVATPVTCMGQCTPPSFAAVCDGKCTTSAQASCTGGCDATCMTSCMVNPGSFDCAATCESGCKANCSTTCSGEGAGCDTDCQADCHNRCGVQCDVTPPSADCTAKCQASCGAQCQVQANINCQVDCTTNFAPGACQVDCQGGTGAVFCGTPPQYVDIGAAVASCVSYLETQGISVQGTCTLGAGCNINGIPIGKAGGCSAAPVLGADDRWGALGIAGLVMGLGLVVSRRKRRG